MSGRRERLTDPHLFHEGVGGAFPNSPPSEGEVGGGSPDSPPSQGGVGEGSLDSPPFEGGVGGGSKSDAASAAARVEALREQIRRHDYLYFVLNRPEISDEQ